MDGDVESLPEVLLVADRPISAASDEIAEALRRSDQRDGHDARGLAHLERPIDVEADQRHPAHGSPAPSVFSAMVFIVTPFSISCEARAVAGPRSPRSRLRRLDWTADEESRRP